MLNESYNLIATSKMAGKRLDKILAENIEDLSRTRIQALIESGNIYSNNELVTDRSHKIRNGDDITIEIPEAEPTHITAKVIPLDIPFEDEYMLVINKAAGMTVHPGAGNHSDTLVNALLAHCGDSLSGIGGVQRPGIVHRLDKDTSGLMVVAKTDKAHVELAKQIEDRSFQRVYQTVCWGAISPRSGEIEGNIGRSTKNRKKMAVVPSGGKEALTYYTTKEVFGIRLASHVECKLKTGRTHQIRVHMTENGHSLIGDQSYGNSSRKILKTIDNETAEYIRNFPRQALHSHYINFLHPISGDRMEMSSPLPEDMQELIDRLHKI